MHDLMGWGAWNVVAMDPCQRHTDIRRIFRSSIGPQAVLRYDPLIEKQSERLIGLLHDFSGDPVSHMMR